MRDLAVLLFVAGTLPMALLRPVVGLLLWMVFSYMNPHRMTWGFAASLPWVMVIALVTFFSMAAHSKQRQMPPMKMTMVTMTLFLIWTVITTTQAVLPDQAFARLDVFLKMIALAYVTTILIIDREKLHWAIWVIVLSFGFWGAKGGVFTILTGGHFHVFGPSGSFFHDNNQFALVMCMTLPLMRFLQTHTDDKRIKNALWVLMGLTIVSVLGTYSRGGVLALTVVGFMLILKSRNRKALIALAPLVVIGVITWMPQQYLNRISSIHRDAVSEKHRDASAVGRIESWKFAFRLAEAHPLVGGGFNVWASDKMWNRYGPSGATHRAIHSIFFEVLAEHGFVGLVLFVLLLAAGYLGLGKIKKQARAGPETQYLGDLAGMLQVCLIGYTAAGSLLPMPYMDLLYQMLALVAVMQVLLSRQLAGQKFRSPDPDMQDVIGVGGSASPDGYGHGGRARPERAGREPRPERPKGIQDLPPW